VACCIVKTTAHSMAWLSSRNRFSGTGGSQSDLQIESRPGALCYVLVLQKQSLPRGSSAAGAGPSWVLGGTRGMPSGEIWGGNGPAAGALIGLKPEGTMGMGNY
jgi:hypothetical protein